MFLECEVCGLCFRTKEVMERHFKKEGHINKIIEWRAEQQKKIDRKRFRGGKRK